MGRPGLMLIKKNNQRYLITGVNVFQEILMNSSGNWRFSTTGRK